MKTKSILFSLTILFLFPFALRAQSEVEKAKEKVEQAEETVDKAEETWDKFKVIGKKLFPKKNKKKGKKSSGAAVDSTGTQQETAGKIVGQASNSSGREIPKEAINPNALKAGDVHPDAVVLDVDFMSSYNKGAAVIRRNLSTALINDKGEFIVPYNTFNFHDNTDPNMDNSGLFICHDSKKGGSKGYIVDADGNVLQDPEAPQSIVKEGNFIVLRMRNENMIKTILDIHGKELFKLTNVSAPMSCYRDGLIPYNNVTDGRNNYEKGYKNIKDQIIIPAQWEIAECFSEGAAIVGNRNEFGEMQYGFINTDGKIIVPIKFSKKPENFSDGLAKIYSTESLRPCMGRPNFSYINNKGEFVLNNTDFKEPCSSFGDFHFGHSFHFKVVMDKQGETISQKDFLMQFGIPSDIIREDGQMEFNDKSIVDGKILISFQGSEGTTRYQAYLDLKSKTALFYFKANAKIYPFDPVSNLAYTRVFRGGGNAIIREGYINEKGIFMIVKGEPSRW